MLEIDTSLYCGSISSLWFCAFPFLTFVYVLWMYQHIWLYYIDFKARNKSKYVHGTSFAKQPKWHYRTSTFQRPHQLLQSMIYFTCNDHATTKHLLFDFYITCKVIMVVLPTLLAMHILGWVQGLHSVLWHKSHNLEFSNFLHKPSLQLYVRNMHLNSPWDKEADCAS